VPFAKGPPRPIKIRAGSVNEDPPPAMTFIKPAILPTPKRSRR